MVQIGKAKFRLRSLWLPEALASIFARFDRLHCGENEPTRAIGPVARYTANELDLQSLADLSVPTSQHTSDFAGASAN